MPYGISKVKCHVTSYDKTYSDNSMYKFINLVSSSLADIFIHGVIVWLVSVLTLCFFNLLISDLTTTCTMSVCLKVLLTSSPLTHPFNPSNEIVKSLSHLLLNFLNLWLFEILICSLWHCSASNRTFPSKTLPVLVSWLASFFCFSF